MHLPKNKQETQKGQILIIFLLVLVVGVAIVLALASRTFTDVKTTTTSDESNRAYFAAEAGIESALKKISGSAGNVAFNLDFTNVNQTQAAVDAKQFQSGTGFYGFPDPVQKDDVVQLSLLNDFNNLYSGSYQGSLDVYWQETTPASLTALEIALVYFTDPDGAGPTPPSWGITKWAFDPDGARSTPPGNSFCNSQPSPLDVTGYTKQAVNLDNQSKFYAYKASINLNDGTYIPNTAARCINSAIPTGATTHQVLLRIKPLYNQSASISIGVQPSVSLPSQGYVVESSGSTISGVTRKLRVIQPYPSLPALFDYALFNGSISPLTK